MCARQSWGLQRDKEKDSLQLMPTLFRAKEYNIILYLPDKVWKWQKFNPFALFCLCLESSRAFYFFVFVFIVARNKVSRAAFQSEHCNALALVQNTKERRKKRGTLRIRYCGGRYYKLLKIMISKVYEFRRYYSRNNWRKWNLNKATLFRAGLFRFT